MTCLGADVDDVLHVLPEVLLLLLLQPPRHVLPELARLLGQNREDTGHKPHEICHTQQNEAGAEAPSREEDAGGEGGRRSLTCSANSGMGSGNL